MNCRVAIAVMLAMSGLGFAADDPFAFEVASIKPSAPGFRQPDCTTQPGGLFTCHNIQLKYLFRLAVGPAFSLTKGDPAWFDETYDIDAKIASDKEMSTEELRVPLLALFKERLGLVAHEDVTQETYYVLEQQTSGVKLKASPPGTQFSMTSGAEGVLIKGETMSQFAGKLAARSDVNARVVDNTGLVGQFDFNFPYVDTGEAPPPGVSLPENYSRRLASAYSSTLDAVLSVGLRLRQAKRDGKAMVIDQIHRPTEN